MTIQMIKIKNKNMRYFRMVVSTFIAAGVVGGCSSIPDAINPLEWFDNSVALFSNEDPKNSQKAVEAANQKQIDAASDTQATFSNLSKVDQQQKSAAVRANGLIADVEGRKYAPAIARQGEATKALSIAPSRPSLIVATVDPVVQTKTPELAVRPSDLSTPAQIMPILRSNVPGQDDFQTRFSNRLAEIRAEAAKSSEFPQYLVSASNQIAVDTVVVSSLGVISNYDVPVTKYVQSVNMANSKLTYLAKPMKPLSDNVVRVATIRFKNGSAKLSSRDRQILANVVRLKKERGGRIHIVGHASSRTHNTDPVNHKMINFRVSAARADVVARELQRLGADKSQFQVDAVSDSAPEYLEVMPTGEAGNRRTEIYLDS